MLNSKDPIRIALHLASMYIFGEKPTSDEIKHEVDSYVDLYKSKVKWLCNGPYNVFPYFHKSTEDSGDEINDDL